MFPKTKKLLLIFLVSFEILALNIYPVAAGLLDSIPGFSSSSSGGFASPDSMLKEIEKRYNLDPNTLKNFGQEMNVSEDKGTTPEVQIFFSPTDPKPGEEVTATANATGYKNQKENLVYVWYLAHQGDDDVNHWKIEAMRKIANNGFRSERVNYNDVNQDDNDGYDIANVYGGDNTQFEEGGEQVSKQHLYAHDYETGKNYELSDGDNLSASEVGDPTCTIEGMSAYCLKNASYFIPEGIYGTGGGEGGEAEGGDGGDGGASTGGGGGGGGAGGGGGGGGGGFGTTAETGGQCVDSRAEATCDTAQICPSGYMPLCLREMPGSGIVCRATRCGVLNGTVDPWSYAVDLIGGVIERNEEDCTDENGNSVEYSSEVSCESPKAKDNRDFHLFPNYDNDYKPDGCPDVSDEDAVGDKTFSVAEECFWQTNPYDQGTSNKQRNDGAVTAGVGQDKLTWIYQPGDKVGVVTEGTSFYPTKYDDSSNMVMMAMPKNSCIENMVDKDNPSVKVESVKNYNVQIPTLSLSDEDMNECLTKNLVDPAQGGQGKKIIVKLTYSPQNPINGQANATGDQTRGDLVTLRTSLEDSNRDEALLYYKYTIWAADEVRGENQPGVGAPPSINSYIDAVSLRDAGWVDATAVLKTSSNINLPTGTTQDEAYFEGNGLSSIKFRLNNLNSITDPVNHKTINKPKYLLATVEVFEGNRTNELNAGVSGAMITMSDSSANLKINLANSSDGTALSNAGNQICMVGSSGMCEVISGQILQVGAGSTSVSGIAMQNYQWTLDGKTINCSEAMGGTACSSSDGKRQGGTIFFPVDGSPGDIITLALNANEVNPDPARGGTDYTPNINTGLSTNITQQFLIVEPSVKIVTPDDAGSVWSAVLGEYYPDSEDADACTYDEVTSEGTRTTNTCVDTSQSTFGTNAGNAVTLNAQFSPKWLDDLVTSNPDMFEIKWIVDGQEVTDTGKSVSFTAGAEGDVHSVEISVMFKQDIGSRRAVTKFGAGSQEHYFSDSVQVQVFGGSATAQAGPRKYFASLISNVPGQTLFMLRIALTIFVIILVSNILSSASIIPRAYAFPNRNKK